MKEIQAKSKIGAGLFTDEPLELRFNFEDGSKIEVVVSAITNDMVAEFFKAGIKFGDYDDDNQAVEHGQKVFNRIAQSAVYYDPAGEAHDLTGKYKDRIMQLPDVMAAIFDEARKHAAELAEEDEGNSES